MEVEVYCHYETQLSLKGRVNPRYERFVERVAFRLREVEPCDAPVAVTVREQVVVKGKPKPLVREYRAFDGQFWKPVGDVAADMTAWPDRVSRPARGLWRAPQPNYSLKVPKVGQCGVVGILDNERERVLAEAEEAASQYIVVDGATWVRCHEPVFEVENRHRSPWPPPVQVIDKVDDKSARQLYRLDDHLAVRGRYGEGVVLPDVEVADVSLLGYLGPERAVLELGYQTFDSMLATLATARRDLADACLDLRDALATAGLVLEGLDPIDMARIEFDVDAIDDVQKALMVVLDRAGKEPDYRESRAVVDRYVSHREARDEIALSFTA